MIKIVAPPRLKSKDFEEIKKSLADHSGEIMRVVKTLYEKYERPIEPQEFVLSWFSRQARVAEMLTDDGKNDIEGVVVWTVESPLYSDKVSGYVRFLFADTEEKREELLKFVIEMARMANCHTLFYDSGKRNVVDDSLTEHIYHELNMWQME